MEQSANDFPDTKKKNVIILITDGNEECSGDPCKATKALQLKQVALKPYIIGIGLSKDVMKSFDCVGKNYSPKTDKDFGKILSGVVSDALENTTIQIELYDSKLQMSHTNIPVTLTDVNTGKIMYQFEHTMHNRLTPDTFSVDPNYIYDITMHTIPKVVKEKVSSTNCASYHSGI